ncbi:conjugal transfer protein TraF [Paraburkholderia sp. EG287A]|uniref:conjugal transfer protein TraF n=1 Tax=Paraburkholderia sp. EG287A TaxID=3237012 RepID=UPI0034D388F6
MLHPRRAITTLALSVCAMALSGLAAAQSDPESTSDTQTASAQTSPVAPSSSLNDVPARQGWFWYLDPKKEKKKEPKTIVVTPPTPASEPSTQAVVIIAPSSASAPLAAAAPDDGGKHCKVKDTWESKCGFVDPGNDFDFQAKERDILLQQMSLQPDKPEVVEAAQRYMKWVVTKASMAANMWYFNMVQHPDLDPTVQNPISEIGIALASRVDKANQVEIFDLIRQEGGVLFYFSRDDCDYCHEQAPNTRRVARMMGLQLINVPLDGKCLPGFEGDNCGSNITNDQVAPLNVAVVPALYLYVPDNTWIRLGTGVVTDTTVIANTVNFFSAYRSAVLNGLDNSDGVRPSVTFDPKFNAKPTGVTPADGSSQASAPDRSKMLELLGYGANAAPNAKK